LLSTGWFQERIRA